MKNLVVFYSLSGNTELVANTIAQELKADIFRVEEVNKRRAFFKYITGGYAATRDKCSSIKPVELKIEDYDRVFLGSPAWAAKPVPAINAFIKNTNFANKEVIAFFTMGGKSYEKAARNITPKIESSSGRVIGSFGITTAKSTGDEMVNDTLEAIASYAKN